MKDFFKKVALVFLASVLLNFAPGLDGAQTTFAKSGACSGHGGVNCSAGADGDGSVICYDGWTGSSVSYSSMAMCSQTSYTPTPKTEPKIEYDTFTDLPTTHKNKTAILYLYDQDILKGYNDGSFKPESSINRAELLKVLVEALGMTPEVETYNNCFTDVKEEWFAPYVCYAKSEGWVNGYNDGSFKPGKTVNKVEAIKILLNSQNIEVPETVGSASFSDVPTGQWFAPYVQVAKELGILEETGSLLNPSEGMKRASISENIYRLMMKKGQN